MSTRTQRLIANITPYPQYVRVCTLRRVLQSLGYDSEGIHMILDRAQVRFVGPERVYMTARAASRRMVRLVAKTT